jgi:hypothetical protein
MASTDESNQRSIRGVSNHSTVQGSGVTADANPALGGFPTANIIEETTMSHYQDNERGRLAKHRGQPVTFQPTKLLA